MQYYFCSTAECALKINGEFICVLNNSPVSVTPKTSSPFIEVYPTNNGCGNFFTFILNQNFLNCPPDRIMVTDLDGGYLITFTEQPNNMPFSVIKQQKYPFSIATVFTQNGYNLTIETHDDFFTQTLPVSKIDDVEFFLLHDRVLAIGLKSKTCALLIFDLNKKITKLLEIQVDDFEFSSSINTTQNYLDIAKHVKKTEWQYVDNQIKPKNVRLDKDINFSPDTLPCDILPYAFLEELLVDGDYKSYLGEEVLKHSDKLKAYFGEYLGVCPPPSFISQDKIGLIYSDGKNKYKLKYASFNIINRKITNFKLD